MKVPTELWKVLLDTESFFSINRFTVYVLKCIHFSSCKLEVWNHKQATRAKTYHYKSSAKTTVTNELNKKEYWAVTDLLCPPPLSIMQCLWHFYPRTWVMRSGCKLLQQVCQRGEALWFWHYSGGEQSQHRGSGLLINLCFPYCRKCSKDRTVANT